jgi:hypothetical protein
LRWPFGFVTCTIAVRCLAFAPLPPIAGPASGDRAPNKGFVGSLALIG